MKLGISIIPVNEEKDLEIIKQLFEINFKFFSLSDYYKAKDPFILLEKICSKFKKIRIGIAVTNLISRKKEELEEVMLRLANYDNEIFLGIGAGDWQLLSKVDMNPAEAIAKLKEGLLYLNRIRGKGIKLYVGAQGIQTLKLTRYADGALLNLANEKDLAKALSVLEELKLEDKEKIAIAQLYLGNRALENARKSALVIYAGLSDSSLKLYGYDRDKRDELRSLILRGEIERARSHLSLEEIRRLTIAGDVKEVIERINSISKLELDGLILGLPMGEERKEVLSYIGIIKSSYEES